MIKLVTCRIFFLILFVTGFTHLVHAQSYVSTLSQQNTMGDFYHGNEITLLPGFSAVPDFSAYIQTLQNPDDEVSEYTHFADSMFQYLNKSGVTTGILYDRVIPLARLKPFNNNAIDTSSNWHFIQAYSEMRRSAYHNSGWLTVDHLKSMSFQGRMENYVPIGLGNYQYHYIDTNAVASGLISFTDSMFYDLPNRPASPFKMASSFVASPMLDSVPANVSFRISPEWIINHSATTITSLSIDFGDGGGYRSVSLNGIVGISYPSNGVKTLKFYAGFNNGTTATTYAVVKVVNYRLRPPIIMDDGMQAGSLKQQAATTQSCDVTRVFNIKSKLPFQGYDEPFPMKGEGNVKIFYATNGACDGVLRKPIIIVDGFDPRDTRSADALYNDYLNLQQEGELATTLRAKGYDIVILNFPLYPVDTLQLPLFKVVISRDGGADYIERNARVLMSLIDTVNTIKNNSEKLVIIGPSMGGLISRYALAYMEKNNMPHNTRLWVSFDSPHKGANIPIGDQYFLDYYANRSEKVKDNRDKQISSVAAKQMLNHHFLARSKAPAGAPGFHDRFYNDLAQLGFPKGDAGQPLRRIALVDGSLGGTEIYSPCAKGFTFDTRHFVGIGILAKFRTFSVSSAYMHFTPSYGNECTVFKGDFSLKRAKLYSAFTYSFTSGNDVAPGGYFNTQGILEKEGDGTFGFGTFKSRFYSVLPNHSFISTKSALAMSLNSNLSENISNRNLFCTGETPFDSYFGQFNKNSEHVELWPEATTWITKEIDNEPQQPSVQTNYTISGKDSFCGTSSYQLNNVPSGTGITWSVTGPVTINGSSTSSTLSVTSTGQGSATLTASVVSCGSTNYLVTKTITVGAQSPGPIDGYLDSSVGKIVAEINPVPGATSYKWYLNGSLITGSQPQINIPIRRDGCGRNYHVAVEAIHPCGASTGSARVFYEPTNCKQSYTIYPNPSSNQFTVEYKQVTVEGATEISTPVKKDFEAKLLDSKGNVLQSGKTLGKSASLVFDTRNVQNGNYFLHIYEGDQVIKKQVLIEHK